MKILRFLKLFLSKNGGRCESLVVVGMFKSLLSHPALNQMEIIGMNRCGTKRWTYDNHQITYLCVHVYLSHLEQGSHLLLMLAPFFSKDDERGEKEVHNSSRIECLSFYMFIYRYVFVYVQTSQYWPVWWDFLLPTWLLGGYSKYDGLH